MKIGVIGLGNIAQKAYLPILTNINDLELILCTRNTDTLDRIANKYHISQKINTVAELIEQGINAAFVHASTDAHIEILEKLINNNIHVYVDKPISNFYNDSLKIVELAEKKAITLMVGFNRRFAPMYTKLKEQKNPNTIIIQKNRINSPGNLRTLIYDDFIHVLDTARYLLPDSIETIQVHGLKKDMKFFNIIVQLQSKSCTAIAIMNRDNGINEEIAELMVPGNKFVVRNLDTMSHFLNGEEKILRHKDWDPILYRRGFEQTIYYFLDCVRNRNSASHLLKNALITHEICEKIITELES
jgi:virulence factor